MTAQIHPEAADPPAQQVFDERVAQIRARDQQRIARRQMWHAHHWPDEYHRCTRIAGRPVCRRCLILYPAALVVAAAYLAGFDLWPVSVDPWPIWLLCLPATVDFVSEQLGRVAYSAKRQMVTSALLAPALGRGTGYELENSWSWEFWGPVMTFGTIWFAVAVVTHRSRPDSQHG